MTYFNKVKEGDKVWDFQYGWGNVIEIYPDYFKVKFKSIYEDTFIDYYSYNGKRYIVIHERTYGNQILFWREINYTIATLDDLKLLNAYPKYLNIDNLNTKESLKQLFELNKVLSLREQECIDSKQYQFTKGKDNWYIYFNDIEDVYDVNNSKYINVFTIYFKTKEDAKKVCYLLNMEEFKT